MHLIEIIPSNRKNKRFMARFKFGDKEKFKANVFTGFCVYLRDLGGYFKEKNIGLFVETDWYLDENQINFLRFLNFIFFVIVAKKKPNYFYNFRNTYYQEKNNCSFDKVFLIAFFNFFIHIHTFSFFSEHFHFENFIVQSFEH